MEPSTPHPASPTKVERRSRVVGVKSFRTFFFTPSSLLVALYRRAGRMGTRFETILDLFRRLVVSRPSTLRKPSTVTRLSLTRMERLWEYLPDIAVETAKDSRAWPYTKRDELAQKFQVPAMFVAANPVSGLLTHRYNVTYM